MVDPPVPPDVATRADRLGAWLAARGRVAIACSGGVDSSFLAVAARDALGASDVLALLGRSASVPADQWARAHAVAAAFDVPLVVVETEELADPRYAANAPDRCFHCKQELWRRLAPAAAARGFTTLCDGTLADDDPSDRPGMAAGTAAGIATPLADAGLTKADVRLLSRVRGLPTWDQPAAPCLASRIPHGVAVTVERLAQVDRAEAALRALGVVGDLRVRHHGALARIELSAGERGRWTAPAAWRRVVAAVTSAGFAHVEAGPAYGSRRRLPLASDTVGPAAP